MIYENDDNWFAYLEQRLFTILQFRLDRVFGSEYPDMNYSSGTPQDYDAILPSWHMTELTQAERGRDLENKTVNAVYETIQVEITTNDDFDLCHDIATQTTVEFKKLRFDITMSPTYTRTNRKVTAIARYSRTIGKGELQVDTR